MAIRIHNDCRVMPKWQVAWEAMSMEMGRAG